MRLTLDETDLTSDAFLGGQVELFQPRAGYRAGVDPVLLAASVPAQAGQSVLDLGCGVGAIMACLAARVPGLHLSGLEVQPGYAALAERNMGRNNIAAAVHLGDVSRMPEALRAESFDHVVTNPPYFDRSQGSKAHDAGRDQALGGAVDLALWLDAAVRRLKPGGRLSLIQRAERLPEVLSALDGRVGDCRVVPLAPRVGRAAKLVIVQAVKGARAPFRLLPPVILHEGAAHLADGEDYTAEISDVLRRGAALNITY